jgi:hypothetical protein
MMNVYDIIDDHTSAQVHSVVAESIAEAERVFLGKYPRTTIKGIKLHSAYVQIQKHDEQRKSD